MDFDALAVQSARGRGAQDLELGELLVRLFEGDRLLRLGYARQVDYIRERLGVAARSGYAWVQLARGLARGREVPCPTLREAVEAGLVSSRKALLLLALPDPDAWTRAAIAMNCVDLERCVRAGGFDTASTEFEVDSIVLRMTPEQQDRLDAALELARSVVGPAAPRWQMLEAIAMEYLGEFPHESPGEHPDECAGECAGECDSSVQMQVEPPVPEHLVASPGSESPRLESPGSELPTDPKELDRRARGILNERRVHDAEFGRYLLGVQRSQEFRALGFDTFESYVRDRLGIAPRTARARIWLEKRMEELPSLREALSDGRLTLEKARLIAKSATPFCVDERINKAASTTCQQVEHECTAEEDRQNRARGVRRIWGPSDAFAVLMDAISAAGDTSAGDTAAGDTAAGDTFDAGECLARIADHFVEVWTANLEKPPGTVACRTVARRTVLGRHGGLCGVPGCSAEAQHAHHIRYRSRGGGDEIENRVALCAAHHLHGVHAGYLTVEGRAGEKLVWRFGGETWHTTETDDVRRAS